MAALQRCRSCQKAVRWVDTVAGRKMPLDPDPTPRGNVVLGWDYRARVLQKKVQQCRVCGCTERDACPGPFDEGCSWVRSWRRSSYSAHSSAAFEGEPVSKKNKIEDLRDHLFETIEALKDEHQPMDLARARTIADVARVVVDSAKVEVEFLKATGERRSTNFLPTPDLDAERPARPQLAAGGVKRS